MKVYIFATVLVASVKHLYLFINPKICTIFTEWLQQKDNSDIFTDMNLSNKFVSSPA